MKEEWILASNGEILQILFKEKREACFTQTLVYNIKISML